MTLCKAHYLSDQKYLVRNKECITWKYKYKYSILNNQFSLFTPNPLCKTPLTLWLIFLVYFVKILVPFVVKKSFLFNHDL